MAASGQIRELKCYYDSRKTEFHSVVVFGRDVCGFPQTVHGGLTAAIIDETFGGLMVSLWRGGKLGLNPPGYTARLEVRRGACVKGGVCGEKVRAACKRVTVAARG